MSKYLAIFGKPRYLGIVPYDDNETRKMEKGDTIIADSYRGEELAIIVGELTEAQEKKYRQLKNASESGDGVKTSEPVVTDLVFQKFAASHDLEADSIIRAEERDVFVQAKKLLEPHDLDMKLIDVEFLRKRKKLFFYFSSEQRVDFRAYVRDLAREFKTRIELRQIGVRDEAKVIRGVSPCGLPCCCSYWLNQFAPINIRMVKEQNLALNPSKISGICGRLMCCMHYEHNVYHEMWSGLPNPGSKIKTPNGNIIVAGVDLTSESVRCLVPGRGEMKVPIAQFAEFKQTVVEGKAWEVPDENETSRGGAIATDKLIFGSRQRPKSETEEREDRSSSSGRQERRGRREKPDKALESAAPQAELQPKKKRRKRGRGGAAKQADSPQVAVKQEKQPVAQAKEAAAAGGRTRRPHRRGRKKPKGDGSVAAERGDN